jgi:coenzyme Q-binding protein COQ10
VPSHTETRNLPFTAEQMFAVVADVERYPEFVPGCVGLRVRERERAGALEYIIAEMLVSYHGLRERYVSRVTLDRQARTIHARHVEGAFHHLDTRWRFTPDGQGCIVEFSIDFAFKNRLLSAVAGLAFFTRAAILYGGSQQAAEQPERGVDRS